MLSTIADIAGIVSCIASIIIFIMSRSIFKNVQQQKVSYNEERIELQTDLSALREIILKDNVDNMLVRSKLRQALFSYRHKYWNILSPASLFHIVRSLRLIKTKIPRKKKEDLCRSLDYLIACLDKKEDCKNE